MICALPHSSMSVANTKISSTTTKTNNSYRPGWDCHGLPIELKALAELKVTDRSNLSPTQVRAVAQATAQSAVDSQRQEFSSYAVMGDWANGYKTMDRDFETRQLRVFYEMMNKGLIYRANKPVYWSPSSKTALAESELEYKDDHRSRSAWVAFVVDQPCKSLFFCYGDIRVSVCIECVAHELATNNDDTIFHA